MLPRELKPEHFNGYPPEARKLVVGYIGALRRLPLSFLPSLLREMVEYDFRFPVERRAVERELANLSSLSAEALETWFKQFAQIQISPKLESFDWINCSCPVCRTAVVLSLDNTSTGCISRRRRYSIPAGCRVRFRRSDRRCRGWASRWWVREWGHYDGSLVSQTAAAWSVFQPDQAGKWTSSNC